MKEPGVKGDGCSRRRALLAVLAFLLFLGGWVIPTAAQQAEAEVLLAQATLAYDDGRYQEALDLLDRLLATDPRNARALYYKGLVYLAQKKPELAVPALESARALKPEDLFIRYQLGVAYFALGQYDKARPLLTELFKEQPQLEGLGFYVGFLRYRDKDYQGALAALDRARTTDPNMRQLIGFYRGLTLGTLGLSEQAINALDEALKIEAVEPLTGATLQLRDRLGKVTTTERRFKLELNLGGFYNDNVAINPDPSSDPLAELLRSRKTSSTGLLAGARADYSWYRNGPFEATATYSFFQTLNFNDGLSSFNIQDHLGGLAGFYRGTLGLMPYQVGLSYAYDYLFLDEAGFLSRHSPSVTAALVENAQNLTTAAFRFQDKTFLREGDFTQRFPAAARDARNWMGGFTHVLRFQGDRHLLSLGYQYDVEDAKGADFSYDGHRVLAGGLVTLPWGDIRLRYDYQIHFRDYRNLNATFPLTAPGTIKRNDTEQIHFARIEKPLPFNLTFSLQYQRIQDRSNLAIYAYTQNMYSAVMTWNY